MDIEEKKTVKDEEVIDLDEEKKITVDDIKVYRPIEKNINYRGEWLFVAWAFVYWIIIPKTDNKVKITYNISPDQIHPDHYIGCDQTEVPKKVYKFFLAKVNADISRLDNMMFNLTQNKWLLSIFFNYIEKAKDSGSDEMDDVEEYTEADAAKDREMEQLRIKQMQQNAQSTKNRLSPDKLNKLKNRRAKTKTLKKQKKK